MPEGAGEESITENISSKKDFVTRCACDSPCVMLDGILCDFCFDIWLVL